MYKLLLLSTFFCCLILTLEALERNDQTEITPEMASYIVLAHNKIRATVNPQASNMIELQYDNELASHAKRYAQRCIWKHNPNTKTYSHQTVGENLAYNGPPISANASLASSMRRWADEMVAYDKNQCYTKVCGHYTQMIWAKSKYIGCGIALCPNLPQYVVCNYAPTGNVGGGKPYKEGRCNTECPAGERCLCGKPRQKSAACTLSSTLYSSTFALICSYLLLTLTNI